MLSKRRIAELSRLKTKKGRDQQGRFLVEGLRLCEEAADSSWPIESVLFTAWFEQKPRARRLLKSLQKSNAELASVKSQVLEKLSDTATAQGIVCVGKTRSITLEDLCQRNPRVILALDGIRDPGNVGTLVRTAHAFGVEGLILSSDTVELFNPKLVRASMGSVFHLPVADGLDLEKAIIRLKKWKFRILGTQVAEGRRIETLNPGGKTCLLMGGEAEGMNRRLHRFCDQTVHISMPGRAESLNVAVAGGILLHEIMKKRSRRGR